jgi:peptide/nickel transport system ATP-binding protein
MTEPILALESVSKRFVKPLDLASRAANLFGAGLHEAVVHAVDEVRLAIAEGEVVGLVGESGCGKSTLGRMAAGLLPPSDGRVRFRGVAIDELDAAAWRDAKLKLQMIFQDPMASLNPRMRVIDLVGEAPVVHGIASAAEKRDYVDAMLMRVGLDPSYRSRYPHQFSGGQRARIGIARALAVRPDVLVCDEPVAALDVSIQAQILNLLKDLKSHTGLGMLLVAHELSVVRHMSDRVAVMYLGRIVELAAAPAVFESPQHPYTQSLLKAVPRLIPERRHRAAVLKGDIPSPLNIPPGCRFHPRCPRAQSICREVDPPVVSPAPGHIAACHFPG